MADRVRMQTLALSTTALGQGDSFWHAGGELLRSTSLDRNSDDSGDWLDLLDLSRQTNGFGPGPAARGGRRGHAAVRAPAARRPGAEKASVSGPATHGVIVMRIDDTVGRDPDRAREGLVVVDATPAPTTQVVPGAAGGRWTLHPVQARGFDPVVRTASVDRAAGSFPVPARTVAVFETR